MATDIIARGMITEYIAGTNINFTENRDGTVEISASGSISSEDSVARDAIGNHKSDTSNPHNVTPAQIGLGNVDNTSDLDKPISTAVKQAIDNKADKTIATTSADGLMSASDKGKLDNADNTYALKSKYGDTTIDVGRKAGTTVGNFSTAEGRDTTASNAYSHAEGYGTTASGVYSHAEGYNTIASGQFSHATGKYTQALRDYSVACGTYNKSNDDTLFSIGDGTSDSARHNAFEITTTGGKLHDKDIATTDMSLPANGGNADTVDGKHANDFKAYQRYAPIYEGDLLDMTEMGTYSCSVSGVTNLPSAISNWCYVTMIRFRDAGYRRYICTPLNNSSTGTNELYLASEVLKDSDGKLIWRNVSEANKPYVTGSATIAANSSVCVTNHGFIASAIIWWDGNVSGVATSFNMSQFVIDKTSSVDRTINYLIFK